MYLQPQLISVLKNNTNGETYLHRYFSNLHAAGNAPSQIRLGVSEAGNWAGLIVDHNREGSFNNTDIVAQFHHGGYYIGEVARFSKGYLRFAPWTYQQPVPAGYGGVRYNNTSKRFEESTDGGAWQPLSGRHTAVLKGKLSTLALTNNNQYIRHYAGTYDHYSVVAFKEGVWGAAMFDFEIPYNLAPTPNLRIYWLGSWAAGSGGTGNALLYIYAKNVGSGVGVDAQYSLINTNASAYSATNISEYGQLVNGVYVEGQTLRVQIVRSGDNGTWDTGTAEWWLHNLYILVDVI